MQSDQKTAFSQLNDCGEQDEREKRQQEIRDQFYILNNISRQLVG